MGSRLRRLLRNFPASPTATPITLTSILSQDGRGGKRGSRLRGRKEGGGRPRVTPITPILTFPHQAGRDKREGLYIVLKVGGIFSWALSDNFCK